MDRRHRLAINYIWNLPGPRTDFLARSPAAGRNPGVTVIQSGATLYITNSLDRNGDGQTGPDRQTSVIQTRHTTLVPVVDTTCSTGLRNPEISATGRKCCVTRNDVFVVQVAQIPVPP